MARVFITGSADGLGQLAARSLIQQGHGVVLHARNARRALDAREAVPDAEAVLIGDLARPDETQRLAEDVNALGRFDAVIHNAGVYQA
ncbi:MAG TPA: SDR family NAD(P)-dependent oxidoreductase, partial [Anaerolineales bacterium]|nr:SDR family NAD(P)-dependent oxidoreductase [Anaerolineales bacterium]